MKAICCRTICILLTNIILIVCCSCEKPKTIEDRTQPTDTTLVTKVATAIETETEGTIETIATNEPEPDFVELSDLDLEAAVAKMMPIMTGYALYMYEEEIKYSAKYLEDNDFVSGAIINILSQLYPGDDSSELSYEEMDQIVHASFSEYSGDAVVMMTRDNFAFDEQADIFKVEGSDPSALQAEVVGYTTYCL